jgi:16S rRNA (uracil1498-N3)-methyltransferase
MIRLYVDHTLQQGVRIPLEAPQNHYLSHVMRLLPGQEVAVFNGSQGLWQALYTPLKRQGWLSVAQQSMPQPKDPFQKHPLELHLYFSLFKRQDWVIEKGTEMGVTHFHPVLSARSSVQKWNVQRAQKIAIEACEQSLQLTLPVFFPVKSLEEVLATAPHLCVGYQESDHEIPSVPKDLTRHLLIGPEGGWSLEELEAMKNQSSVSLIRLGASCLRSETAAIVGLSRLLG